MRTHSRVALRAGLSLCLVLLGIFGRSIPAAAGDGPGNLWQSFVVGDGLPSGNILSILAAQDGTIWSGTDAGVRYYDGQWRSLPEREKALSGRIRAIVQTEDAALWFGTDTGLVRRTSEGAVRVWTTAENLPDNDVRTLTILPRSSAESKGLGIWIGTKRGLAYLDGERVVVDSPIADADIRATTVTADGELVVSAAGKGVWRRDRAGLWQSLGAGDLAPTDALALWGGRDGRLWAGTPMGLIYYQDSRWHPFPLSDEDSNLSVLAVQQDREGGLWADTDRGVFYIPDASPESTLGVHFGVSRMA